MISVEDVEQELEEKGYEVDLREVVGINKIVVTEEEGEAFVVGIDDDEGIALNLKVGGENGNEKIYGVVKYEHFEEAEEMREELVEKIEGLFKRYEKDNYIDFDKKMGY